MRNFYHLSSWLTNFMTVVKQLPDDSLVSYIFSAGAVPRYACYLSLFVSMLVALTRFCFKVRTGKAKKVFRRRWAKHQLTFKTNRRPDCEAMLIAWVHFRTPLFVQYPSNVAERRLRPADETVKVMNVRRRRLSEATNECFWTSRTFLMGRRPVSDAAQEWKIEPRIFPVLLLWGRWHRIENAWYLLCFNRRLIPW